MPVPFRWATSMNSFAAEYIGAVSSASTTSGVAAPLPQLSRLTFAARCVKLLVKADPALALENAAALFGERGQLWLNSVTTHLAPPARRVFLCESKHVRLQHASRALAPTANSPLPPLPPPPVAPLPSQDKQLIPWNAGSGADALSLSPALPLSPGSLQVHKRTIGSILYPFAHGSNARDSLERIAAYCTPPIPLQTAFRF
jgi:hypothetical protein